MGKINYLLFLFFLCLFSQSCSLFDSSLLLDKVPTSLPTSIIQTPTPTHTSTPTPVPTATPIPIWGPWKMPITVTEKSGNALTDYQVCIDLSTDDFNYSHVQGANGEDLRFYSGTTIIPYWIQTWNSTGKSRIWIKVPSLAANGTTPIVMYYGTVSATPLSDGNATMLLYDNFDDDNLDSSKWIDVSTNVVSTNQAHVTEAGGRINCYNNDTVSTGADRRSGYIRSVMQFEKNISLQCTSKMPNNYAASNVYFQWDGTHGGSSIYDYAGNSYILQWNQSDSFGVAKLISNVWTVITTPTKVTVTKTRDYGDHVYEARYYNNHISILLDGTETLYGDDSSNMTTTYIGFSGREQRAGNPVQFDNVIVRKYVPNEPTFTLGAEQPNP